MSRKFFRYGIAFLSAALLCLGFQNCAKGGFNMAKLTESESLGSEGPHPTTNAPPTAPAATPPPVPPQANGLFPTGVGWAQLPGTKFQGNCAPDPSPNIGTGYGCHAVIDAWNGGIADTKRNRLVFFGGGHNDYDGNEFYAIDLLSTSLIRLNDPSPLLGNLGVEIPNSMLIYPDGRPSSRHNYNGITYAPHADKMSMFGGSPVYLGGLARDLWNLDFKKFYENANSKEPWTLVTGALDVANYTLPVAAYDPVSKLIFISDSNDAFYSHNVDTNEVRTLTKASGAKSGYNTFVVAPEQRTLYSFGYSAQKVSLAAGSDYKFTDISDRFAGGPCAGITSGNSPGVDYHTPSGKIVVWNGGASVFIFDPRTETCEVKTYGGPAPAKQSTNGTFGRFRYFPAFDAFVLVNDAGANAYVLRL